MAGHSSGLRTKIFVDITKHFVESRSHAETDPAAADRRRAGDPARAVGPWAEHRPADPRRAVTRPPRSLHHDVETAADHDRKGAGPARRGGPVARLRIPYDRRPDAAPTGRRPARPRFRRLGFEARAA